MDECFAELIRSPDVNFKLESCMAHTYKHRNSFSLFAAAAVTAFIRSLVAADRAGMTDKVTVVITGS